MKHIPSLSLFMAVLYLSGCGVPSKERFEPVSNCVLEHPIVLNQATPAGITLTALELYADLTTKAVKDSKPKEWSFYNVSIGGTPREELLGFKVTPGAFGAGIPQTMGATLSTSEVDEEGLTHFYPFRRDISGGIREKDGKRIFRTRVAEKPTDLASQKSIATALTVVVLNNQIVTIEANWPVTDRDDWRDGEHQLPKLGAWEWPSHAGANEVVCLKNGAIKTR